MWRMMQHETAEDFVIATGETHTEREFIEAACAELDINLSWEGTGVDEIGIDTATGKTIIKINPRYFRPTEVDLLLGDPTKAKEKLGWEAKTKFAELAVQMTKSDYELLKAGNPILY
jgi:GDPmannose 4,6-dehydratase